MALYFPTHIFFKFNCDITMNNTDAFLYILIYIQMMCLLRHFYHNNYFLSLLAWPRDVSSELLFGNALQSWLMNGQEHQHDLTIPVHFFDLFPFLSSCFSLVLYSFPCTVRIKFMDPQGSANLRLPLSRK